MATIQPSLWNRLKAEIRAYIHAQELRTLIIYPLVVLYMLFFAIYMLRAGSESYQAEKLLWRPTVLGVAMLSSALAGLIMAMLVWGKAMKNNHVSPWETDGLLRGFSCIFLTVGMLIFASACIGATAFYGMSLFIGFGILTMFLIASGIIIINWGFRKPKPGEKKIHAIWIVLLLVFIGWILYSIVHQIGTYYGLLDEKATTEQLYDPSKEKAHVVEEAPSNNNATETSTMKRNKKKQRQQEQALPPTVYSYEPEPPEWKFEDEEAQPAAQGHRGHVVK